VPFVPVVPAVSAVPVAPSQVPQCLLYVLLIVIVHCILISILISLGALTCASQRISEHERWNTLLRSQASGHERCSGCHRAALSQADTKATAQK
jgi:hypothetical protein